MLAIQQVAICNKSPLGHQLFTRPLPPVGPLNPWIKKNCHDTEPFGRYITAGCRLEPARTSGSALEPQLASGQAPVPALTPA